MTNGKPTDHVWGLYPRPEDVDINHPRHGGGGYPQHTLAAVDRFFLFPCSRLTICPFRKPCWQTVVFPINRPYPPDGYTESGTEDENISPRDDFLVEEQLGNLLHVIPVLRQEFLRPLMGSDDHLADLSIKRPPAFSLNGFVQHSISPSRLP